jgi:hypothetical protein
MVVNYCVQWSVSVPEPWRSALQLFIITHFEITIVAFAAGSDELG